MINILDLLLTVGFYSTAAFVFCFLYYIVIMKLNKNYGMTWGVKLLGGIFLVFVDTPINIFIMSVWFWELPQEYLVITRLKRWRKEFKYTSYLDISWLQKRRLLFAVYVCDRHLDKYDSITGDHC